MKACDHWSRDVLRTYCAVLPAATAIRVTHGDGWLALGGLAFGYVLAAVWWLCWRRRWA